MRLLKRIDLGTFPGKKQREVLAPLYWHISGENKGPVVIANPGRKTDGGSIPRLVWPLIGHPFDCKGLYGYIIHDILYRYPEDRKLSLNEQKLLDITFYDIYPEKEGRKKLILNKDYKIKKDYVKIKRSGADKILFNILFEVEIEDWKKITIYNSVRMFGWRSWK